MFKFRLEPLITIRDNVLRERQRELAQAHEARRRLEEAQQVVERQLTEGIETARSLIQAGQTVHVDYLLGLRRQEIFLRSNQNDLTKKMKMVDEEIERRRLAVMNANKELKIIEKLKEKKFENYQEEEKKQEIKILDEIAGRKRC